jgi:hypothetical protein
MKSVLVAACAAISLSAAADVIGVVEMDGGARFDFFDDKCPLVAEESPLLKMEYVAPNGSAVVGCYIVQGETVHFMLADGRQGSGPVAAIKPPKRT